MPNALRKNRGGRKKTEAIAKTPDSEYSPDDINTNTTEEVIDMTENYDYDGGVDTLERDEATPELPDFASMVEDAPDDVGPTRTSAGRKRIPSPFDTLIVEAKGQGWKRVPHGGSDEAIATIKRQLQKAQHFAGLGMDLGVTDDYVWFKVRDKQARTRKNGQNVLDATGGEQDENDRDE